MSAREDIEGWFFSPDARRIVSRELDKHRDEVLREAAEKIRQDVEIHGNWHCCAEACGSAADLIDPDKDTE